MSKSNQALCICGKSITMGNIDNDEENADGTTLEVMGEKNKEIQLFHSIDCALISQRLESVYNNSNLFFD